MVDKIKEFFRSFTLSVPAKPAIQGNNDDRSEQSQSRSDQKNDKGGMEPENCIEGSMLDSSSVALSTTSSQQEAQRSKKVRSHGKLDTIHSSTESLNSISNSTHSERASKLIFSSTLSRDPTSTMHSSSAKTESKSLPVSNVFSSAFKSGHHSTTDSADRSSRWDVVLSKLSKLIREALRTTCLITSAGAPPTTTNTSNTQTDSNAVEQEIKFYIPSAQMHAVLESLKQMGTRDIQLQIHRYYCCGIVSSGRKLEDTAKTSTSNRIRANETERLELLKSCRRALLDCWKFALDQLKRSALRLYEQGREDIVYLYYELIGHLAERCEFHPPCQDFQIEDFLDHRKQQNGPQCEKSSFEDGHETDDYRDIHAANQSGEVISENRNAKSPDQLLKTARKDLTGPIAKDETMESDIDAYRWSLVATFHHVVEIIERVKQHKRPSRKWMSITEAHFFSKIIAVAFVRITPVQMMILEHILLAVEQKEWSLDIRDPSSTSQGMKSSRRRHSSGNNCNDLKKFLQAWNGCPENVQKCGRLRKTKRRELEGVDENKDTYIPSRYIYDINKLRKCASMDEETLLYVHSSDTFEFTNVGTRKRSLSPRKASRQERIVYNTPTANLNPLALKSWEQEFPALFGWTMYKPYLASSADVELFSISPLQTQDFPGWLDKITHDGEFFACFMSSYIEHLAISSYSAKYPSASRPIPWTALPGYTILVKTLLLLVREASWEQWQMTCRNYEEDLKAFVGEAPCVSPFFALSRRGISTVLDQVHRWLRVNPCLLDPCVLALLECTNAYSIKSVSQCLSNLEKWFSAAATPRKHPSYKISTSFWRMPTSFQGLKFVYAMRRLISSENFEILKRVLLFLYRRMDYFEDTLRQQTLKILIQRHMKLFLHWNFEVRRYYHHLLVFRVARVSRTALNSSTDYLLVRKGHDDLSTIDNQYPLPFDTRLDGDINVTSCYDDSVSDSADDSTITSSPPEIQELLSKKSLKQSWTKCDMKWLRREQAFWRAFDACIAKICCDERRRAHERNQQFQQEQEAIQIRALSFDKLHTNPEASFKINSVNEGLPGAKMGCGKQEVNRLNRALYRQPPYYLRYLPTEHVSYLRELKRLASHFKYPDYLQVYASTSLREYSDTLTSYFQEFNRYGVVEAPSLEFC